MIGKSAASLILGAMLGLLQPSLADAASKEEIDAKVQEAIDIFYKQTSAGKRLSLKAAGMLVFPEVVKAGIGIGGEYGEGALIVNGLLSVAGGGWEPNPLLSSSPYFGGEFGVRAFRQP